MSRHTRLRGATKVVMTAVSVLAFSNITYAHTTTKAINQSNTVLGIDGKVAVKIQVGNLNREGDTESYLVTVNDKVLGEVSNLAPREMRTITIILKGVKDEKKKVCTLSKNAKLKTRVCTSFSYHAIM